MPDELASRLGEVFTEVIVAPDYDAAALDTLAAKKNLRVLVRRAPSPLPFDVRPVDGGFLVQQPDAVSPRSDGGAS